MTVCAKIKIKKCKFLCSQGWSSGSAAGAPRQRGSNPGLPAALLAHLPGAATRAPRAPPAAPAASLVRLSSGHHLPLPQDQPMLHLRTPAPPGPWERLGGNIPHLGGLCLLPATLLVGSVRTVTSRVWGFRRDDESYLITLSHMSIGSEWTTESDCRED